MWHLIQRPAPQLLHRHCIIKIGLRDLSHFFPDFDRFSFYQLLLPDAIIKFIMMQSDQPDFPNFFFDFKKIQKLDGLIFSCCTSILAIHWLDAAALDPSHLNNSSNSNQLSHSFVLVVQLFGIFSTACWFFIFLDTCLMFGDICANVFSQQKWARLHRIPETCIALQLYSQQKWILSRN